MKFTFNWLKEFVTIRVAPEKLAELFTMAGLEVESLTPLREADTHSEDWLFEIGVTPNRGDCLSIAGRAREGSDYREAGQHRDRRPAPLLPLFSEDRRSDHR